MMEVVINVDGMSCEHCVNAITKALKAIGVKEVYCSLKNKTVTVKFDDSKISLDKINEEIEVQGYSIINK